MWLVCVVFCSSFHSLHCIHSPVNLTHTHTNIHHKEEMVHIRGGFEPDVFVLDDSTTRISAEQEQPSAVLESTNLTSSSSSSPLLATEMSPSNHHLEIQRSIQIRLPSFQGLPAIKDIISMFALPFICFLRTFEQALPTRELYTISIVLLCCHQMLQLLWRKLPLLLLNIFIYLGVDKSYIDIYTMELMSRQTSTTDLIGTTTTTFSWALADLEALDRIVQSILHDVYIHMNSSVQNFQQANKVAAFFHVPITAIMIPTTILSFFLLLTITTYLIFHLLFHSVIHLTRSEDGFMSHSPVVMACITLILLMEYLLPWIFFCTGLNLSIYVGGSNWGYFTTLMYFAWMGLRLFR